MNRVNPVMFSRNGVIISLETWYTFVLLVASQIKDTMADKYYITATLLTLIWITGFLFFDVGPYVHIFLVLAFVLILVRTIRG